MSSHHMERSVTDGAESRSMYE